MRFVILLVTFAALVGCAVKQPQMSREEFLRLTQRTYEGKTPEDVYSAAEKLFRLADGDDFRFFHTEDSLVATRSWLVYIVIGGAAGTDTWTVRARPVEGGTKVAVALNTSMGSVLPMPTTGGDMAAGSLPAMAGNVTGSAIYDIFWARMDYLLGKSDKWMTCEESNARARAGIVWGSNEALCNSFNVKDQPPDELPS